MVTPKPWWLFRFSSIRRVAPLPRMGISVSAEAAVAAWSALGIAGFPQLSRGVFRQAMQEENGGSWGGVGHPGL